MSSHRIPIFVATRTEATFIFVNVRDDAVGGECVEGEIERGASAAGSPPEGSRRASKPPGISDAEGNKNPTGEDGRLLGG